MSYLLDTDILSLLFRPKVPEKLTRWAEGKREIFISTVTLAEQEFGLEVAPKTHRDQLENILQSMREQYSENTLSLSLPVLIRWKQLIADLKKKNRTMSCEDSLIAATALHFGYKVVTRNTKDFQHSGVETVNPLA